MGLVNRHDLRTIFLFGIHIGKVDDNFDVWEKKILKRFADAVNLTAEERAEIAGQKFSLKDGLASLSSPQARNMLIKTLCAVSYADGTTHPNELDFIDRVISKAGATVMVMPRDEWGIYEKELFEDIKEFV